MYYSVVPGPTFLLSLNWLAKVICRVQWKKPRSYYDAFATWPSPLPVAGKASFKKKLSCLILAFEVSAMPTSISSAVSSWCSDCLSFRKWAMRARNWALLSDKLEFIRGWKKDVQVQCHDQLSLINNIRDTVHVLRPHQVQVYNIYNSTGIYLNTSLALHNLFRSSFSTSMYCMLFKLRTHLAFTYVEVYS